MINVHRLLNEFDIVYGKKHKLGEPHTDYKHIYIPVIYDVGKIVLKIYVKENKADYIKTDEDTYELILFKDNVYTNTYIMKKEDDRKYFINKWKEFNKNSNVEILVSNFKINLDGKILKKAYFNNRNRIEYMFNDYYRKYEIFNNKNDYLYKYEETIDEIKGMLTIEKCLLKLIREKYKSV